MQELSLSDGLQRRDFMDVVWQIAEKRGCDEVVIRYDCNHAIRADVWAPALPKTREYGTQEAERRRFMQHCVYILTKDPGAPKVQITVPEGRCRHCGRGQRQVLIVGPLQVDITEVPIVGRRLELPLSSHTFLAAMGQVCRLPENITPPPILPAGSIKPFDGPPLPREGVKQWTRREVEDELKADVLKYVGITTVVLLLVILECVYLCILYVPPASPKARLDGIRPLVGGGGENATLPTTLAGGLSHLPSVTSLEMGIANSTWALSAMTFAVHKAFGPAEEYPGGGGGSLLWSVLVHPLWVAISMMLAPLLWMLDLVVAIPRFVLVHICLAVVKGVVWRPVSWLFSIIVEVVRGVVVLLYRCIFSRPTAVLSQIPLTNPMVVALVLSLLVAALSAPQPPSLSLPNIWGDLPSFEFAQGVRRAVSRPLLRRFRSFWYKGKDGRPSKGGGGPRGIPTTRGGQKERPHDRSRERPEGKPDGGRALWGSVTQTAPPCFVCLDRPSRYVLEPCGHRVVCGDCAVQLVEAAARNRSVSEAAGVAHHQSERSGGGACPSCGMAITRAMRLFS